MIKQSVTGQEIWEQFDIAAGEAEYTWLQDENPKVAQGLYFAVMNGEVKPEDAQRHAEKLYGPTRVGIANRVRIATLYLCAVKQGKAE